MLKTHSLPFTELKLARTQARLLPSAQTQQILLDLDPVFIQEMQSTKKTISRHSDSARPSTAALLRTLPAVLLNFLKIRLAMRSTTHYQTKLKHIAPKLLSSCSKL